MSTAAPSRTWALPDASAAADPRDADDQAVLAAALAHLVAHRVEAMPSAAPELHQAEIAFSPKPVLVKRPAVVSFGLAEGQSPWEALTHEEFTRAQEAFTSLDNRMQQDIDVIGPSALPRGTRLFARDPEDDRSGGTLSRFGEGPVRAMPPGYSEDGTVSLVCFVTPWGAHGQWAVLALVRHGAQWDVRTMKFINFW